MRIEWKKKEKLLTVKFSVQVLLHVFLDICN